MIPPVFNLMCQVKRISSEARSAVLTLTICFAIESECFARRGSKSSFPVYIPSRAGYCGACSPTPRLPHGSYSNSLALAMLTFYITDATATAQATVAPTIGLFPMPMKPIISTWAGTEEEPANWASECMRPMVSVIP